MRRMQAIPAFIDRDLSSVVDLSFTADLDTLIFDEVRTTASTEPVRF